MCVHPTPAVVRRDRTGFPNYSLQHPGPLGSASDPQPPSSAGVDHGHLPELVLDQRLNGMTKVASLRGGTRARNRV